MSHRWILWLAAKLGEHSWMHLPIGSSRGEYAWKRKYLSTYKICSDSACLRKPRPVTKTLAHPAPANCRHAGRRIPSPHPDKERYQTNKHAVLVLVSLLRTDPIVSGEQRFQVEAPATTNFTVPKLNSGPHRNKHRDSHHWHR